MFKKIIVLLVIASLFACQNDKKKGILDEKFVIENIKAGMSAKEVFDKIGRPQDSVTYRNHEGNLISVFSYDTNNLFDYHLKVIVDSTNKVISVSFD